MCCLQVAMGTKDATVDAVGSAATKTGKRSSSDSIDAARASEGRSKRRATPDLDSRPASCTHDGLVGVINISYNQAPAPPCHVQGPLRASRLTPSSRQQRRQA